MRGHSRFCWTLLLSSALVAFLSAPVHAYGVSGAGGKLGLTTPEDHDQTMMIGGHVELEQSGTRVHLMPNLMYWHVNRESDVNPNFDAYYHFGPEGNVSPYLGAGLGLNMMNNTATDRSRTDLGANMIGGVRFPGGANHYFVEGRYTASDVPQVSVLGGITFHTR